jgi:hypothetical protein
MGESVDIVDEMLDMARNPDPFSKEDMAEMVLLAATEIIRLREFPPVWVKNADAAVRSLARKR